MRNFLKIIFIAVCLPVSTSGYAKDMLIDVNVLFAVPDAGSSDDFHTGKTLSVNYNYYFLSWLAATAGVFISEEISTDPITDVVGTYQATIESEGITFGLRSDYQFSKRNRIYGRAGLLLYKSKLTVDEFFSPGVPSGSSSDTTDGQGYFIAIAWAHSFTKRIRFQLELSNMTQLDLFKGETTRPFDLSNTGVSLGLGYAF